MSAPDLNPRLAVQVRLALSPDDDVLAKSASHAGLTGAEIDAARAGRSFDVGAEAAIVLALALKAGACTTAARLQAGHVGFRVSELSAIAALAETED